MVRSRLGSAFYNSVLKEAPDPVVITDEHGVVIYSNRAANDFFSESRLQDSLVELPMVRLIPEWFGLPSSCRSFKTIGLTSNSSEKTISLSVSLVAMATFVAAVAIFRVIDPEKPDTAIRLSQENELRALVLHRDKNIASMRSELSAAAKILESHLPQRQIPDVAISWIFQPCQTLGGDMLQVHRYQNKLLLGVLDVSGHGVAASLLAIGLTRALSPDRGRGGCVLGRKGVLRNPSDAITRLNQDSRILFESGLFVTLLFGTLDLSTGECCFTCAGHPLPIRLGKDGAEQVKGFIDPPLGVDERTQFQQSKICLNPGDLLVFFTDGVTETRARNGEFFGETRLISLLSELGSDEPRIAEKVHTSLRKFQDRTEPSDDVTLLTVRYLGRA